MAIIPKIEIEIDKKKWGAADEVDPIGDIKIALGEYYSLKWLRKDHLKIENKRKE